MQGNRNGANGHGYDTLGLKRKVERNNRGSGLELGTGESFGGSSGRREKAASRRTHAHAYLHRSVYCVRRIAGRVF